jgi:phenylalanine ammonia-lyase
MEGLTKVVSEEAHEHLRDLLSERDLSALQKQLCSTMHEAFESTSTLDNAARMVKVADSTTSLLFGALCQRTIESDPESAVKAVAAIPKFRHATSTRLTSLMDKLRKEFLTGTRGPAPASQHLNKTRPVYEYVRVALGIKMHGVENYNFFENGMGVDDVTVGEKVSIINEAIRDGKMQSVVVNLFS